MIKEYDISSSTSIIQIHLASSWIKQNKTHNTQRAVKKLWQIQHFLLLLLFLKNAPTNRSLSNSNSITSISITRPPKQNRGARTCPIDHTHLINTRTRRDTHAFTRSPLPLTRCVSVLNPWSPPEISHKTQFVSHSRRTRGACTSPRHTHTSTKRRGEGERVREAGRVAVREHGEEGPTRLASSALHQSHHVFESSFILSGGSFVTLKWFLSPELHARLASCWLELCGSLLAGNGVCLAIVSTSSPLRQPCHPGRENCMTWRSGVQEGRVLSPSSFLLVGWVGIGFKADWEMKRLKHLNLNWNAAFFISYSRNRGCSFLCCLFHLCP